MRARFMNRKRGRFLGAFVALAAVAALMTMPTEAGGPSSGSGGKSDAVKFEEIPGSTVKRVILTAKAAERLGIETGEVGEETITLTQMVGGRVVPAVKLPPIPPRSRGGFAGFGQLPAAAVPQPVAEDGEPPSDDETWVLITLSEGEWDRLQKDGQARVLPLATRDSPAEEVFAVPSEVSPFKDPKRSMMKVYYKVACEHHGLTLYNRVRVELPLSGTDEKQRVVPYSAVYYDSEGSAWVYTNPEPMTFERQPIVIDRVLGDQAVLSKGPPVGTEVVTVGAALLYGAEVFFGK